MRSAEGQRLGAHGGRERQQSATRTNGCKECTTGSGGLAFETAAPPPHPNKLSGSDQSDQFGSPPKEQNKAKQNPGGGGEISPCMMTKLKSREITEMHEQEGKCIGLHRGSLWTAGRQMYLGLCIREGAEGNGRPLLRRLRTGELMHWFHVLP